MVTETQFTCLKVVLITLIVIQGVFIVMERSHYTADVVVASYLTPLLWHFRNVGLFPYDVVV